MAEEKEQMKTSRSTAQNFLRQFRDKKTRKFREISAANFMDVWNHYDSDGNGYIEGSELDKFLFELITSVNTSDTEPEPVSQETLRQAKASILSAFDENKDGKIDIAELAQLLPMEENFLLLFRREHPLESSVEFMKTWRKYDEDHSGYIEADELKHFLKDLLDSMERSASEEQLITYADTMLQLFDRNRDGKLQLSEMAKLLPVKENFLMRPIFKFPSPPTSFKCPPCGSSSSKVGFFSKCRSAKQLTSDDISRVFRLYDRDDNKTIEDDELHGFLKDLMELVQEDYDAEDIDGFKQVLLKECDINHDGKIDKNELSMVLLSFSKTSQCPGEEEEEEEAMDGEEAERGSDGPVGQTKKSVVYVEF